MESKSNGTIPYHCSQCPETIRSDSDIAGIGVKIPFSTKPKPEKTHFNTIYIHLYMADVWVQVIISFGLSGFLTTAAALTASVLYNDISIRLNSNNSLRPFTSHITTTVPQKHLFWLRVLDRVVLSLSDQQLVTGFSILVIGCIKLRSDITIYHFACITNLAMFSCSAHLASVISLRRYFQDHPEVAWVRLGFMSTFALLLAVSLSIFGVWISTAQSAGRMGCPATCLLPGNGIGHFHWVGWALTVYLVVCYWAAYSYVFPNAEIFFTKWLFTKPLEFVEKFFGIHQFHERFMHRRPVFPSLLVAHLLQFAWWLISLISSLIIRMWGNRHASTFEGGSETSWGFGQLLAIFLIVLPFLNGVEIYFGKPIYSRMFDNC
jgi:hypothetical protein